MCLPKSNKTAKTPYIAPPEPPPTPPPPEATPTAPEISDNRKSKTTADTKRLGRKSLRIDLSGLSGGSGVNVSNG